MCIRDRMETATRPRFAIPKALEIKAFSALNVRRCVAAWPSPPSACAGSVSYTHLDVYKRQLYESLVGGMLTKEEYASYKAKYTKQRCV